jgi:GH25 family lysozyme M1 (1,4-beta-N-acetylmuramidase)
MTVFGWDASDYDWSRGPMDIAAAAHDGIQFFTHKATEGTGITHVNYKRALSDARSAGIPFLGAYMVVRTPGSGGAGNVQDQVDFFLARLDSQTPWWHAHPGFFLQVDLEHWSNSSGIVYDAVAPQHGVLACDLLRAETAKWVVLYAPKWAYGDSIGGTAPLWSSAYGKNPAMHYLDAYPGDAGAGWVKYSGRVPVFWQFGSRLTIGGQLSCDANAFRGTLDELRALIGGVTQMSTDWGSLGPPKNYAYSADPAAVDVQTVLRTGEKTGWDDDDGKGWWIYRKVEQTAADASAARKAAETAAAKPAGAVMTEADRAALIAELKAELPTAADIAKELIAQLGNG